MANLQKEQPAEKSRIVGCLSVKLCISCKKASAKISAMATVGSVQNLVKLTTEEITEALFVSRLALSAKQKECWHKKCLCLVGFKDVKEIEALDFEHQGNMDDWLIIEKIEDVLVGSAIPYNYEKSRF